jgi:uncharacterized protein
MPQETTFHIIDHMPIRLSDGCTLSARIWQPDDNVALPAILEIHPYPKRYSTAMRDEMNHGWFASHGYVSLRVDLPGSGDSEGYISDEYRPEEHAVITEVIAWMTDQEWCDGNVGMFGHSWGGYNGLQMAALNPPGLKAVVASGASDDLYNDDCHFRGGVMEGENMSWAATKLSFFSRPPDPMIMGDGWKETWVDRLEHLEWILPKWLKHPTRDEHWKYPSLRENYGDVKIPVLVASGWADTGSNCALRMAADMPDSFRAVVGPWAHKFAHMGMPKPAIGWLQECVSWWDHWLKGIENDVESTPKLRFFIPENVQPETGSDSAREGRWTSERQWPSPSVSMREYNLGDGVLGHECEDHELEINSPQTLGTACGELMPMGWGADMPGDQRQDDGQSLVFDSTVVTEAFDILGTITVNLTISSDKPVAFIVGRLCDVAPDGSSTRVCYGAMNLTHSSNHEEITYLKPGEPVRVKLKLDDIAYRFCKGHRIRLALSNAYWPLLWPSPESATLTVLTVDSMLALPVRTQGGQTVPTFEPAAMASHLPRTVLEPARNERTVTRDLATGEAIYKVFDWAAREQSDVHGLITGGLTERTYSVHDDDPSTCNIVSKRSLYIERDGQVLRTQADAQISCSEESFFVTAQLTAWDGDQEIFNRSWDDTIAREGH